LDRQWFVRGGEPRTCAFAPQFLNSMRVTVTARGGFRQSGIEVTGKPSSSLLGRVPIAEWWLNPCDNRGEVNFEPKPQVRNVIGRPFMRYLWRPSSHKLAHGSSHHHLWHTTIRYPKSRPSVPRSCAPNQMEISLAV
jgi:hypothetical protein